MESIMSRQSGFTIVELMIVLAIVGILITVAIPSFRDQMERRRLIGAAELVYEQLSYAKSEALKRQEPICAKFTSTAFGITDKDPCDCDPSIVDSGNASACTLASDVDDSDVLLRRWDFSDFPGVSSSNTFTGGLVEFEPIRGTASTGTVTLASANHSIGVVMSAMGRVRMCSPNLGGYPDNCP